MLVDAAEVVGVARQEEAAEAVLLARQIELGGVCGADDGGFLDRGFAAGVGLLHRQGGDHPGGRDHQDQGAESDAQLMGELEVGQAHGSVSVVLPAAQDSRK